MMIVPGEMEEAVDDEMDEMMPRPSARRLGLAADDAKCENDIPAAQARKAQHVGRRVAAAMAGVQPANRTIIGEHDANRAGAPGGGADAAHKRLGARHETPPGGHRDEDVGGPSLHRQVPR